MNYLYMHTFTTEFGVAFKKKPSINILENSRLIDTGFNTVQEHYKKKLGLLTV